MPDIAYTDMGSGNPVILLHGFCESKEMWEFFQTNLSTKYRVLCPDLPGFGDSPLPEGIIRIETIAEALRNWMKMLNVVDPVVIGHSLGGYVTLGLVDQLGETLKGIGLFHSTAMADDEDKVGVRNKTVTFLKKFGTEPFVNSFLPQLFPEKKQEEVKEIIDKLLHRARTIAPETVIAYTEAMRDRCDRSDVLERFAGKKFFIAGELDSAIPIKNSRKHFNWVTDYLELKETGHMGMFEKPNETLVYVDQFLRKTFN
ncbi:alpha/beta fold hydrolase [Lunatibacter salilacus]|uniref:alpha/beta fold hydrolase n=1 Tax=Lunatibacter salilacus TaxID=2483804 RepID=UPI00131A6CB0|nr:alpha/beta hydrolase [Lunatibacter salilacus]